jgi:Kef-type K+ transport system membrane component KefB/nucleotide-binding universal stress UspA family protein
LPHLTEVQVLRFLAQITLLFVSARVLADLMKRIGQATVIGELAAGIILGPSLLGHIAPYAYQMIFPPDPMSDHLLEAVAWIGVILLLLYTGLETDLNILRGVGWSSVAVSTLGIVIPWISGFALGWEIPATYLAAPDHRLIFALFIAVAMSISAVPVIAKILIDMNLMRRDLGMLILAAGLLDDTAGWLMLSVIAGLAAHGAIDLAGLGKIAIAVVAFVAGCYFIAAPLVVRLMRWVDDRGMAEHAGLSAMVGIAMVCAIITQAIGIHAVFGAFIAGLMIGRSTRLRRADRVELEATTIGVFAPVFFAYSGIKVDLLALHSVALLGTFLGVAIVGKLIGCTGGALIARWKWREALAVGVGMNARGGMGIIVALIGLSLGVLSSEMYAIIILIAIVTSVMTPPLLASILGGVEERPEEVKRLEREKFLDRLPFSKEGAKLLVLSGGGPDAELAAHLAAVLGNHEDASITVFHGVLSDEERGNGKGEFDARFDRIRTIAERAGARNVYKRTGSADSIADAIEEESERGYDAIFAGASRREGDYALGGEVLIDLVHRAKTPVIITRHVGGRFPLRHILAPTTGAAYSRLATTLGILYAHATGARIASIYVRESPMISLRNLPRLRRPLTDGHDIIDEIRQLAAELEVPLEAHAAAGMRPENAILAAAEREGVDLLMMGVTARPSEQRLDFGPKLEHILSNARCAIAVVVSPEARPVRERA